MKYFTLAILVILLGSCATLQRDPWAWMDEPEQTFWDPVVINTHGREIRFSVPNAIKGAGDSVRRGPPVEKGATEQVIDVPYESIYEAWYPIIEFNWEWYWGGFYGGDKTYYKLRVGVLSEEYFNDLLAKSVDERVGMIQAHYDEKWSTRTDSEHGRNMREFFYDHFYVTSFKSAQSYEWTLHNSPMVVPEHEDFELPISDQHVLVFWFWYHWKEDGGKTDPVWLERRKELSRQILDTVQITPDPWSMNQEAAQ